MKKYRQRSEPERPLGGIGIPFKGFSKIRVVDLSRMLPGPYATQILADMGCRVTRVELPYFQDPLKAFAPAIGGIGSMYRLINRGKKTLSFDFRKPAGLRRLRDMLGGADVLVEGFRPGVMARIGLGFEAVRRLNPRLVYCSISGYNPASAWGRKAGHDLNFLAMSGFLGLGTSAGQVAFPSAQVADLAGGMAAVSGILAALLERDRTRRGRRVRISMTDAVHSWLVSALGQWRATGKDPGPGRYWWNGAHPFYRLYQTKDGALLAVAALEKGFALALLDILGLAKLKSLADDPLKNAAKLSAGMQRVFKSADRKEWMKRFSAKDVCVTAVLSLAEAARFLREPVSALR